MRGASDRVPPKLWVRSHGLLGCSSSNSGGFCLQIVCWQHEGDTDVTCYLLMFFVAVIIEISSNKSRESES